jgi:dipeptidyl aminopeptidase/acylaminoacyl peptidase
LISPTDEKRIGLLMSTPTSPSNIYMVDMATQKVEKLTDALIGNISEQEMVKPRLIKYRSFDGLEISAFLYEPKSYNNNNVNHNIKLGAVLSIHGGSTAQERPTMHMLEFISILQITA